MSTTHSLERANRNALFNDQEVMNEIMGLAPDQLLPSGLESTNLLPTQEALEKFFSKKEFTAGPGGGGLEAIVKVTGRPALLIQNNKFERPRLSSINKRLELHKDNILKVIPSVGRVELSNHPDYDYVGTAWLIEEDVMITNRHVAEVFARRQGDRVVFGTTPLGRAYESKVDFNQEHESPNPPFKIKVLQILHMEAKTELAPDMALLKVEKSPLLPEPILLSSKKLRLEDQPDVAVIGYPDHDSRNNAFVMEKIFKGIYQVKRLSPGRVSGVHPNGHILMHDCTTLGGNSGSVVFDLESGQAIGLHYSGAFMQNNYAVTSSTILNRMANLGVQVAMADIGDTGGKKEAAPKVADMQSRIGFDPLFLGEELEVPYPQLSAELEAQVAPVEGNDDDLLHYLHYSVKMHKERRMAIYTAVNIDGGLLYGIPRRSDYWYYDPRIKKEHQAGQELYSHNNIHRGHLVRRLDPAWGMEREEAKAAAKDTFFYTNSTPQHQRFNPRSWLNLEDYILENADEENMKVSVFTGPVFAKTDKIYRGFQIPEEYWKVVVVANSQSNSLSASGYIVSQQDFMNDLEFVYGEYQTFHVPLQTIEKKTGLDFGLTDFDPLGNNESTPVRVIRGSGDIMI